MSRGDEVHDVGEEIMAAVSRRFSKDEFARRGDLAFESVVRPHLKPEDEGRFVAIDIDTSEFEIDGDELTACDRLRARIPKAQIWMVRVGSRYVHRFGGRGPRGA
jgi:hypothetical protein